MTRAHVLFGASKVDITPDQPVYLGGYGIGPIRKCTGISSRLYARAIALGFAGNVFSLVALDTHGLQRAFKSAPSHLDIEKSALSERPSLVGVMSTSTHSHCAPDSTGAWGGLPRKEMERIADGAVEAVIGAVDSLTPARLTIGRVDASELLRNQCSYSPHDFVDGCLTVIRAAAATGRRLGHIVHYSAHATVAAGDEISSDWYGSLASQIDDNLGGTSVVVAGAIGRTQPATRGDGRIKAVNSFASRLCEKTQLAIESSTDLHVDQLKYNSHTVRMPIANPLLRAIARLVGRADPLNETMISALHLGSLVISAFPGEIYPNIAIPLKAEFGDVLCLSLVGDQIGYLIYPAESYRRILRDAYKNDNSYFCPSPRAGKILLEKVSRLIRGFDDHARDTSAETSLHNRKSS